MKKLTIAFSLSLALVLGAFLHTGEVRAESCASKVLSCSTWCYNYITTFFYGIPSCSQETVDGVTIVTCDCNLYWIESGAYQHSLVCPYEGVCEPGGGGGGGIELPDLDKTGKETPPPVSDDPDDQLTE